MAVTTLKTREPILGYEVTERIGAGGYGEVWKATAPGGLTKAIKFIYGYLDDERARRELKALSRVKQVRHAFLLSLERIEVVDGQLVIVTELAEMSLKDRHEQCKAEGQVGIPRDELLGYLRDAADALDFMREKHSLQHLDVKPENLLLLGGHVKVADFGLVKDIGDVRASMMGGLTPLYASPEVFDDRPSTCSDQYSLAIVYQEMLTDTLPFPGKTTAQLAAQHLQSRARLTALPPQDQPIVERALSKDPQRRFVDCRQMVDALIAAGRNASDRDNATARGSDMRSYSEPTARPATDRRQASPSIESQTGVHCTESLDAARAATNEAAAELAPLRERLPRVVPETIDLPPLQTATDTYLRPLLFVSIGGAGARVLRHLQGRIADRFGSLDKLPAMRLLAFDTDATALFDASSENGEQVLNVQDAVHLPLKMADEYRGNSTKLLSWMSRRWLFNIPRSLVTEGLRPLGRLALVDHADTVVNVLSSALDAITQPAAVAETVAQAGSPIADRMPRVFLVASIAGGAGSGMVLDVAYALQKLLGDRALSADALTTLLLHSTGRNPAAKELATANALATLGELAQCVTRGYPGEPSLGLVALPREQSAMRNVYLAHLGDDLGEADFDAAIEAVGEYLELSSVAPTANWFDAARHQECDAALPCTASPSAPIRTFGLCDLGCSRELIDEAANRLCSFIVERWSSGRSLSRAVAAVERKLDGDTAALTPGDTATWSNKEIDRRAQEQTALLSLSLDEVLSSLADAVAVMAGCDEMAFIKREVACILASPDEKSTPSDAEETDVHPLVLRVEQLLSGAKDEDDAPATPNCATAIEARVKDQVKRTADAIRAWAAALADEPAARLKGAGRAVEYMAGQVRELRDKAQTLRTRTTEQVRAASLTIGTVKPRARGWGAWGSGAANNAAAEAEARLEQYVVLRLLELELNAAAKFAQLLAWELTTLGDHLKSTARELWEAAAGLSRADDESSTPRPPRSEAASAIAAAASEAIERRLPELVLALDQELQRELMSAHGGLFAGLTAGPEVRANLWQQLRLRARTAVVDCLRSAAVGRRLLERDADHGRELLRAALSDASPALSKCGGARRLLVIANDEAAGAALSAAVAETTRQEPSVVNEAARESTLCYEVAAIEVVDAAAVLAEQQPQSATLASRLHTRCDITFAPLDG